MKRLLVLLALLPALLALNSCGGSSTAAVPTITVTGAASSVNVNGTVQFTASILNLSSTLVNWQVNSVQSGNSTYGTIDTNGLYTAPKTVPTNNVVTITAVAQGQTSLTATANLTILPAAAISGISPSTNVIVAAGTSQAFSATVSGGGSIAVYWYVNNSPTCSSTLGILNGAVNVNGTITYPFGQMTPQGNYTAPQIPPPGAAVAITAVSQVDSTQTFCVPVTLTFGNASLQGSYAFSTSGRVIAGNTFFARAGSFTAGGNGTIIGGIEDYNQVGQALGAKQHIFTGTYLIGPDGRGTMQFCEDINTACTLGAETSFFRIAVFSAQQAQIIEFSKPNSPVALKVGSGEMDLQPSNAVFNNAGLAGIYSFNFAGVSSTATPQSEVGEFTAGGDGTVSADSPTTPGKMDINNGGVQTIGASPYSISANGRGIATLGSSTFSFYMVSSSRAKFIETDTSAILVGDAFKQQTSPCSWGNNALNGAIVFETGGTMSGAGITDLASFTADGTGIIVAGSGTLDQNSADTVTSATSLGGSYSIDACGRGTLSIPASAPNHTYVFYMTSVGNAVIQEVTSGVVAHGTMVQPQGGSFTAASLNGSYALNLAGTNAAGAAGNEEDFVGQLTTVGTASSQNGNVASGSVDINNSARNLGTTQTGVAEVGTYTVTDTTKGRATMTLTSPQNLVLYIVSSTQAFAMVGSDNTSVVAIGSLYKQF